MSDEVHAGGRPPRIPVVTLSALGSNEDIEAGMTTGAQANPVKLFRLPELLEKVGQLIAAAAAAG